MHVYTNNAFTVTRISPRTNFSGLSRLSWRAVYHTHTHTHTQTVCCIASLSMHDSAHKEQICSLHLSTIDHERADERVRAPRRGSPGASNLDSPNDNDAGALASAVNSSLVHAAISPLNPPWNRCAGNAHVSGPLLINYHAYRVLKRVRVQQLCPFVPFFLPFFLKSRSREDRRRRRLVNEG